MGLRDDRTGWYEARDIEDRARRPYDLFLRLKGQSWEAHWGRWSSAERAHQIGHEEMRNTSKNPSTYPMNKKCTGYRVVDTRNGEVVSDPALVAAVVGSRAA